MFFFCELHRWINGLSVVAVVDAVLNERNFGMVVHDAVRLRGIELHDRSSMLLRSRYPSTPSTSTTS